MDVAAAATSTVLIVFVNVLVHFYVWLHHRRRLRNRHSLCHSHHWLSIHIVSHWILAGLLHVGVHWRTHGWLGLEVHLVVGGASHGRILLGLLLHILFKCIFYKFDL